MNQQFIDKQLKVEYMLFTPIWKFSIFRAWVRQTKFELPIRPCRQVWYLQVSQPYTVWERLLRC